MNPNGANTQMNCKANFSATYTKFRTRFRIQDCKMSDRVSKIILAFLSCTETQNVLFRDYGTPRNITSTKIWTTQVLRQSWKGALSGKKLQRVSKATTALRLSWRENTNLKLTA